MFTDASGLGFAGLLQGQWFQGRWPLFWQKSHIAIKELFPIVLALRLWPNSLKDQRLLVLCDNEAVVHVINNQTSKGQGPYVPYPSVDYGSHEQSLDFTSKTCPGHSFI